MPGTNDPAADDLEQALTSETETTSNGGDATTSDPVLDALKPSSHADGGQKPNAQAQQDYQKRYQSMRPEFDKRGAKLNTWEGILKNPKFAELAKTDPEMRQALAKAGYAFAAEEAEADQQSQGAQRFEDLSEADQRSLVSDAKIDLRFEMEDFAQEALNRRFTNDEREEVKSFIRRSQGTLTVAEAWKLTKAADAQRLTSEQKRLAEARGTTRGGRPRPTPSALGGGEKIDLKKHPSQFNDAEKREFLRNLPTE